YPWPGNVRQLENVVRRARTAVRARGGAEVLPEDLDFGVLAGGPPAGGEGEPTEAAALAGLRRAVAWAWASGRADLYHLLQQRLECELLRHAVAQPGVSQVGLADRLGIARNTLRKRLQEYGLVQPPETPPSA